MKTLVVVDIQPEYQDGFRFDMYDFTRFVNECDCDRVLVLFNGEFTLGMISEEDLKFWYQGKGDEDSLFTADYHDKGYAFFRSCMDHGFADEVHVEKINQWQADLLRYMASSHPEIAKEIVDKKALSDELREKMTKAFETFANTWQG